MDLRARVFKNKQKSAVADTKVRNPDVGNQSKTVKQQITGVISTTKEIRLETTYSGRKYLRVN